MNAPAQIEKRKAPPVRKTTFDTRKPRPGEVIGGGFIVLRRGDRTKRFRTPLWPFEHGSLEAAQAEAAKLALANPGYRFDVLSVVSTSFAERAAA